jgi:hypothetical protein
MAVSARIMVSGLIFSRRRQKSLAFDFFMSKLCPFISNTAILNTCLLAYTELACDLSSVVIICYYFGFNNYKLHLFAYYQKDFGSFYILKKFI